MSFLIVHYIINWRGGGGGVRGQDKVNKVLIATLGGASKFHQLILMYSIEMSMGPDRDLEKNVLHFSEIVIIRSSKMAQALCYLKI